MPPAAAHRQQSDCTVADAPLEFGAGPMKGRMVFDAESKVAGLFVLAAGAP